MLKPIICPSLLSCDLSRLSDESSRMLALGADYLHLDVMDAHFVPNLTFGPPVIKCLRKNLETAFFDVHVMIENPGRWAESYVKAGANSVTFHYEAVGNDATEARAVCRRLRELGCRAGISLKPKTALCDDFMQLIEEGEVDMVLIMTVEPGFGGQSFMGDMMVKVRALRTRFPSLDIQVDGGIGLETIVPAAENGANVIVSGSTIFRSEDPKAVMDRFRTVVLENLQRQ